MVCLMRNRRPTGGGTDPTGATVHLAAPVSGLRRLALLAAGTALLGAGCLFEPRDSEPPEEPPPFSWTTPNAPEVVFENVERTLEAKYLRYYTDSFVDGSIEMVMDPGEVTEAGEDPFQNWTLGAETDRMRDVVNSMEENTDLDLEWVSRGEWNGEYVPDVVYKLTFQRGQETPVVYEGRADIYLDDSTGNYYIEGWIDNRISDNHTWCWLRYQRDWDPNR